MAKRLSLGTDLKVRAFAIYAHGRDSKTATVEYNAGATILLDLPGMEMVMAMVTVMVMMILPEALEISAGLDDTPYGGSMVESWGENAHEVMGDGDEDGDGMEMGMGWRWGWDGDG